MSLIGAAKEDKNIRGLAKQEEANLWFACSTTVAIMVLAKNPERTIPGKLYQHDIGDHLNREENFFMPRVSQSGTTAPAASSSTRCRNSTSPPAPTTGS